MNRTLAMLLPTCLLMGFSLIAAEPEKPKGKVELFNGKDLTGWVSYLKDNADQTQTWAVKDGVLTCAGKPNGYLRTEKAYTQYKVTVEWRFIKAGNTGVLVHINGADKVWPTTAECQGMHAAQGDMYFWSGAKADGLKGPRLARKGADAENPLGEWNTYQVVCADKTITILVNGQEMNKATNCSITSGQIGIQCEGAQIEVRRVTLEPLTP